MIVNSVENVRKRFQEEPRAALWTAIIPAAGRGSRLGYDKPKILYPIAGQPILDHLVDLLSPTCAELIFVLSLGGAPEVAPRLAKQLPGRHRIVIQDEPRGMADAIAQAVPHLATPFTLVIWGDQVSIRPRTIRLLQQLQEFTPGATFCLPLVNRTEPYIHFAQDESGHLNHILKRRESDPMPERGNADCGLFAFSTRRLQSVFREVEQEGKTIVSGTGEWDLHPMLPRFDTGGNSVTAFMLDSTEETVGINDVADASLIEQQLATELR